MWNKIFHRIKNLYILTHMIEQQDHLEKHLMEAIQNHFTANTQLKSIRVELTKEDTST